MRQRSLLAGCPSFETKARHPRAGMTKLQIEMDSPNHFPVWESRLRIDLI
ncbi:hypothetical protein [Coxiella burnetii]|nr:hypothetical protein [Coxiella burnetii]ABX77478.1 hypothetical protein COXBURSA331_A0698 [Coxiella burnetii RSA 331]MDE3400314.1 hypothetical protein [Coxiella burnetii]